MGEGVVELTPTKVAAGGDALARQDDGRVVLVAGALPGERVAARLTAEHRDYARAVTVEVLDASPDRVAPPCPALLAGCGGCTWQHVAAAAQARLKADIVTDALRRIARLSEPPAVDVVTLDEPALRTTARLAVGPDGRAGHRPRGGTGAGAGLRGAAPVPTDACLAAHPLLEDLVVHGRFPGAGEVLLRVGVASGDRLARVDGPVHRVEVPAGVAVVRRNAGGLSRRIDVESTGHAPGPRHPAAVREEIAGRWFRVSADSFFQPGPVAAAGLVAGVSAAVGDALRPGTHLVDAYAGTGLFASVLGAASGARVTAVERDRSAVADARANLADLDAAVVPVEVGRWDATRGGPADVVVADPARPGLGRPGVDALAAAGAPVFVLVSCDPASLARDAVLLAGAGYRLTSVALVDAFPHTFHVETVARFER